MIQNGSHYDICIHANNAFDHIHPHHRFLSLLLPLTLFLPGPPPFTFQVFCVIRVARARDYLQEHGQFTRGYSSEDTVCPIHSTLTPLATINCL